MEASTHAQADRADVPVDTGSAATMERAAGGPGDRSEEEITGYDRSPSDALRTVTFTLTLLLLVPLARWSRDAFLSLDTELVQRLSFLTPALDRVLAAGTTMLALVSVLAAWLTPLVTRRYRLVPYLLLSGLLAAGLMHGAVWFLDLGAPEILGREVAARQGLESALSVHGTAVVAASFAVLAPSVPRRWRRCGAAVVMVLTLLRLLVPVALPATVVLALVIGGLVGSATLLLLGRPSGRPTAAAVAAALTDSGLPLSELEPAVVDARGSVPFFGTLDDGGRVFAKVLGSEQRAADLLFRAYRFLRLKNVGDERAFSSLRHAVEHEALVSLLVRDVGGRTPRLRAIAAVGRDSVLLCYDRVEGTVLDRVPAEALTTPMLRGLWQQVALLRRHRIAHRDLRRANILLDDAGTPWLIDFGFSEVAADPAVLDADVAQLLVSLALEVGADRAVETAVDELGREAVAACLPRLQPNTFGGATREALKHRKGLVAEVRRAVCARCGVPEPRLADLDRISPRKIATILVLVAITYVLAPQLGDLPGIVDRVRSADWALLPLILAASLLTYLGAALSLTGSVPVRLRLLPTFVTQVASSFASKLAPAGLGGMALNVRYLQKSGADVAVATAGVGLTTVGGFVVHMVLLAAFAVWAGRSAVGSIGLPRPEVFAWGALAVLALSVVTLAVPAVRRLVGTRLVPLLRRSLEGAANAVRQPAKTGLLLGGSAVVTLSYVLCLYLSTRAFDGSLPLATVGAVYLAGAAVAAVAPTPGGLGALEAAVIAGLVAAGMAHTIAVPAVFLYRIATYWLPILPGWVALAYLRRAQYV